MTFPRHSRGRNGHGLATGFSKAADAANCLGWMWWNMKQMHTMLRQITRVRLWRGVELLTAYGNGLLFLSFYFLVLLGTGLGACFAERYQVFQDTSTFSPLLFSGIADASNPFFTSFSTYLVTMLVSLIMLFLLGVTAFGVFAIPALFFFKGMSIGLGCAYYLHDGALVGWAQSAFTYIPVAVISVFFCMLFATNAFAYSKQMMCHAFSREPAEKLDFSTYLHAFLSFLVCGVATALFGAVQLSVWKLFG